MKKTLLMLVTACVCTLAAARENITIIYGFSPADSSANYSRNLAEEANKLQDKYTFLFDTKPGGGQVIAANHVKNTPNTMFMTSGVFWVRPTVFPNDSYDTSKFRTVMSQCLAPFAVGSVKYKSFRDVPKNQRTTIAVSGLGVISHLAAIQIQQTYPMMDIVPYKSTADAVTGTVGGQVDFVVGFVGDIERFAGQGMNLLGTTGTTSVGGHPTLVSQGLHASLGKMSTPYNLMVPDSWSAEKAREVREILVKAENTRSVRNSYAVDNCVPYQIPENRLDAWWTEQQKYWTDLASRVKVN